MKEMHISEVLPGMVAAKDVISKNNQVIVSAGTSLSRQHISRIKFYNISTIFIDTASLERNLVVPEKFIPVENPAPSTPVMVNVEIPASPSAGRLQGGAPLNPTGDDSQKPTDRQVTQAQAMQSRVTRSLSSQDFQRYQLDYARSLASMRDTFNAIVIEGQHIDEKKLLDQTSKVFDTNSASLHLFDMLHNMRQSSDAVFAHSINVALISATLGRWLKFSEQDIQLLALCGMLHDIGKTLLPEVLLNKPGKYTPEEYAQMKRHPLLGFNRLKNEEIDPRIKKAALMHHERADGSGYPHALKGDEIHDFAHIVSIADVYDAMTSSRSYRSPICPFQVIANFELEGFQKYHTKYLLTFLQNIANAYQSSRVILSDGRSGMVVMLNQKILSRPIIQLDNNQFLDLSRETSLYIKTIV